MHNLILGISFSGKTQLAKRLAHQAKARGENGFVYDPLKSGGWPEGWEKFSSPRLFLERMKTAQSAHVFTDEAKTLWEYDAPEADKLLYQRRHNGLLVYVIAQRAKMVPPNARVQCSKIYCFKQNGQDPRILADEYDEILLRTKHLREHEFIYSNGFNGGLYKLDFTKGTPPGVVMPGQPAALEP